jgi:hypothetical protein
MRITPARAIRPFLLRVPVCFHVTTTRKIFPFLANQRWAA